MEKIQLYGTDWCGNTARVRDFLLQHNIDFEAIDLGVSHESAETLEMANDQQLVFPILKINAKKYINPDNDALTALLGINPDFRVQMYSATWCPDCKRAKAFLQENGIHFQTLDIEELAWAPAELERINNGKRIIPTLLVSGEVHANPSNQKIRAVLGLPERDNKKVYDVAIVGGGAAGLTTAIYAQRDRFDSIVLEKKNLGGNAYITEKIENYPGFMDIRGAELMDKMAEQARFYGAEIREGVEVRGFDKGIDYFSLDTTDGEIKARSIVLAMGSTYRTLRIPGESDLIGKGVHFCATCDGAFYKDKEVLVIGGGNSALEEGIFLTRFAKKVKIINRSPEFKADKTYIDKLPSVPTIETYLDKTPLAFETNADGHFRGLRIQDNASGQQDLITADGAFVFIGLTPNTGTFKKVIQLDERGFVQTQPGSVATNVPGVFAAGDVRQGAIAQVAAATGEGVIASYFVKNYLREHGE